VDHADTSSSTVARKPGHSTRSTSIHYTQDPFELHKERDYWRLFNFYGRISGNVVTSPHVTPRLFSFSEPVSEIQSKPSGSGTPKTSDDCVSKAKTLESLQSIHATCLEGWRGWANYPLCLAQPQPSRAGAVRSTEQFLVSCFLFPERNVPGSIIMRA
jgi:hypothetical protein